MIKYGRGSVRTSTYLFASLLEKAELEIEE
jgi:hypothetical protein